MFWSQQPSSVSTLQSIFDPLVSEIKITPRAEEITYEETVLRAAANKVIIQGSWTPNHLDFIQKSEVTHITGTDFDGNEFFVNSPAQLTDDD